MLTKHTFTVTLKEMERNLSAYLRRAQAGETLVVMENGKPMVEVKPTLASLASPRPYALCAGEFSVPDDFDAPLPDDFIANFEGR